MKFVIIGGDAAGMSAASRARRNRPDLEITVLEKTEDVSYSACGMPYNIADPNRLMEDLVVRQAQVFRHNQGIDLRTGHCVTSIDRTAKVVTGEKLSGDTFKVSYDRLLIATGASAKLPDLPGVDLPGVMALKNLEDGRRIKNFIAAQGVARGVIIGMGYIALEMVEALHARNIQVDMVKPGPVFLPWMNRDMASVVKEDIEGHGINLHLGQGIKRIEKSNEDLHVVCDNVTLGGRMVLVGIGVKPNSEPARDAGLDLGPGDAIAVDKTLRTSDENIYSAGDCADAFHVVTGKKTWIPLALRANRAGWAVADNVIGNRTELPGIVGTAVFKVFDMQVARTGLSVAEAEKFGFEPAEAMIKSSTRAHAHPGATPLLVQLVGDKKTGLLLGAQLIGKDGAAHRVNAPAVALHAKMTVEEFAQCDLAYAPPFGPTWDPMLTAAKQLLKKM
jgi:NADPH-dependent 2,4-dienoyl-CoA reductase/sulfur reductase-like enzyme